MRKLRMTRFLLKKNSLKQKAVMELSKTCIDIREVIHCTNMY